MRFSSSFPQPLILSLKNHHLAEIVAKKLKIPFFLLLKQTFANSEIIITNPADVRGKDVFLFHSTATPVNESIMELFIAIEALKASSPRSLTLVAPFLAYGRQERKNAPGEPISARLLANLIVAAGVDNFITIDPHAPITESFYNIPVKSWNLDKFLLMQWLKIFKLKNCVLFAPDQGRVKPLQKIADMLQIPLVQCQKYRPAANKSCIEKIHGDVTGKKVILLDDMLDTGGTVRHAITKAKEKGAGEIHILITHGIFSGSALTKFADLYRQGILNKIWVSDSIPHVYSDAHQKFIQIISLKDFLCPLLKIYFQGKNTAEYFINENKNLIKIAHE